jgi:hypothetical protein
VRQSVTLRAIAYSADFKQAVQSDPVEIIILPTLSVMTAGGGSVAMVPPAGAYLSDGTALVTATPAAGWAFLQWLGDATGTNPGAHRPDYFGVPPARSQEALNKLILSVHEAGLQACVHSNGDREIDMLVAAFENALARKPRSNHRHRIEHCSVVTDELLHRIKMPGLVVVPHAYIWEHGDKMENYGAWRWDWMHAARSMLDRGIPIAGHSDSPVSAADPLLRLQDMVTRTSAEEKVYGAKQGITAAEALRVWTLGGAFAEFAEDRKGSIEPGKLADFVVLSADPTQEKPERIKDIVVEKTFIGGRMVFERQ